MWQHFADALDFINNVVGVALLCVSLYTFISLMLSKFLKALNRILNPLGISYKAKFKLLFICRKNSRIKRAFIEYAIIMSKGKPLLKKEWLHVINSFKSFYQEKELCYHFENCTPLLSKDFSESVQRYCDFFSDSANKKTFALTDEEQLSWIISIGIKEVYITPSFLLTGLLSRYEENWSVFINKYLASCGYASDKNETDSTLAEELYLTFSWILWGPSKEIPIKPNGLSLCQISYGDESNSLPAVIDHNDVGAKELSDLFGHDGEKDGYGALFGVQCTVYPAKSFYSGIIPKMDKDVAYYCDKLRNGDFSFALKVNCCESLNSSSLKNYYNTAYVWLMFELVNDQVNRFRPDKSIVFFEHANLANRVNYSFLIETLINKSILHFEKVFSNEKYNGRKYRMVTAFNSEILQKAKKQFAKVALADTDIGQSFKNRIIIDDKYNDIEVFNAFDTFFEDNTKLTFTDIDRDSRENMTELADFYTNVFISNFENPNERESLDNLIYYLDQKPKLGNNNYHIILAKNGGGEIVGGAVFDYFSKPQCGVIEYIAVSKELQSAGIGTKIYNEIVAVLNEDARKEGKKLNYVFCEIDKPTSQNSNKKYLHFWNKLTYKRIDFTYVQNQLEPSKACSQDLWLIALPLNANSNEIDTTTLKHMLYDFFKYSMQIENPNENDHYIAMKNELDKKSTVKLLSIIE